MPRKSYGKRKLRSYGKSKRKYGRLASTKSRRYKTWVGRQLRSVFDGIPATEAADQYASPLAAFPSHRIMCFKYCEDVFVSSLTATPNHGNQYQFALNSLFDPNITGTGHQPYNYDQIANVYRKYRVYECDIQLVFYFPNSTTMSVAVQCVNSQDNNTLTATTPAEAAERTGCKWAIVTPGGNNTITYQDTVKIWDLEGMSYNEWLADDAFAANYNGNPAAIPKINFAAADSNAPVSASTITCRVQLVYKARMYEPLTVGQS